ncbi:chromosome segregation protein SMC [Bombilactobacillus thymidiniphilus]|uniref:Chromosome partition protein Smc n=1 Tax=Bombilactobacillus thymidiniphilus TaxID=2923363 RepID=A0ABY4PCQ7_9LACO|nr:chromosome segregation protein SMC [Bombilactobacillus thymidiniphilus]UQS83471.1 chromosome segregation protein SMC [Bombilactobacillus thymidiniphilus]
MVLKSLQINGFKSFADKTTIDFGTGITGVIGPNGSGKSNLTEAVRWVMGEQSVKSLRGERMQDIIFAGSDTRPPLSRAEVTLTFDNKKRDLNWDHDEVTVQRRLFRDGESEFLINGRKLRLKDVANLFLDAGLGRHSLTIISQGNVEAIFGNKPEARRFLIEEPAGVAGFKLKKQQAQQQLAQTDDNLQRVCDIVQELANRVEPLKEQASIARDYQEQKSLFDQLEQKILATEITQLADQQQTLQEQKQSIQRQLVTVAQQVTDSNQQVTQNREQIAALTAELDDKQQQSAQLSQQLEVLRRQKAVNAERFDFTDNSKEQLQKDIATLQQAQTTLQANNQKHTAKSAQLKKQIKDLKQQVTLLQGKLTADPQTIAQTIEQLRQQNITTIKQQSVATNQAQYQAQQLKDLTAQLDQLRQQLATFKQDQVELTQQENAWRQKYQDQKEKLTKAQTTLTTNNQQLIQLQQQLEQTQTTYYEKLRRYQNKQAELQSLKRVIKQHQGFYQGVRSVLNAQPQLTGVVGVLAELIDVPKIYQTAIQSAASAQLQAIVTQNQAAARDAIAFLRQQKAGRATFLPRDIIKSRQLSKQQYAAIANQDYFVGLASDLISSKLDIRNIIENIFGSLIVVKDIDAAIAASNVLHQRFKIVTLQGDLINPGGSLTGGQNKNQTELLGQKTRYKTLQEQLKQFQQLLVQTESRIKDYQEQVQNLTQVVEQKQVNIQSLLQKAQEIKSAREVEQQRQLVKQQQVQELKDKLLTVQKEQTNCNQQLQVTRQNITKLTLRIDQQKQQLSQKQDSLQDFDQQKAQITEQLQAQKTQLALAENNLQNQVIVLQQSETQLQDNHKQSAEKQAVLTELVKNQGTLHDSVAATTTKIKQIEQQLSTLKEQLPSLRQSRQQKQEQAQEIEPVAQRLFSLQKKWSDEQEQNAVQLAQISTKIKQRLQTLEQDYHLSIEVAVQQLPDNWDLAAAQRKAQMLQQGLQELGSVNLAAIEEYDEVKERYEFLTDQRADLLTARKQLSATMKEMDQEVIQRFKAMFDQVAVAFGDVFPQMFGGGHAKLALTDPADLLNTGIEIIAQPPGKRLQRLSLLSGGEKALTAITLLFALLKVKPVPFCILDEVEASLDDANVERFATFLNQYDAQTQFIVITHRKGTMMQVNQLYGISMQESGVSTVLALDLKAKEVS